MTGKAAARKKTRVKQTQPAGMLEAAVLHWPVSARLGRLFDDYSLDEVVAACDRAIKVKPDHSRTYASRAEILLDLGRYAEALPDCNRSIELEPDFGPLYVIRAIALHRLGAQAAAKADLDRSKRISKGDDPDIILELRERFYREIAESIGHNYNPDMETAEFRAAAEQEGFSVAQFREIVDRAKAAKGELLTRGETATRAKAKPRPKWNDRKGADVNLSPPEFIAKHYATEIEAGTLHRGVIAQEDKPLAIKLANWLRTHAMPEGIDIPTLPEWNTRQLGKLGIAGEENAASRAKLRLYEVARTRARRPAP